ncbi:hypothetical protein HK099_003856 [Clydaea vesicula]|uniref:Uncharacterized protein n=1 Tax=Clydaea vesicula TaxID=447962 RepID=A0AAD5U1H2_9FUNG|nr:hypothetical protein HK099_003856 [Clydaea vesicula]
MEKELIKFLLNTVNDIRETLELNDVEKSHSLLKIVLEDAERHLGSCVNTGYPDSFSNTNQTRRAIPGTGECVVKNDSKLMILDKEKEKTLLANFPIELILQILPHLHRAEGVANLQTFNFAKFNGNVPKYYELFFKLYPFSNIRRLSVPIHKDEVYDIPCYTIFKNLVELNLLLTPGWSKTIMQSILSSTVQLELLQVSEVDIMDYKALEIVSECSKSLKNLTALRFLRPKFQRTDMDTLLIEPTSKREYVEKFIFAIFEVLKNLGHNLLLFNFDAALYDIHIEDFGENLINSLVTHCENLEDFLFDTGALLSFSKENIQKLCTSLKKLKTVHLNSCAPENCEVFLQHKIELCRTTIQCETEPDTDETDEEWGDPYLMGDDYFDSEGSFFYDSDPVEFMDYEPFIF